MRPFAYIALLSALSMNSAQAWWDVAWTERSELKFRASDINSNQNNMAILVTLDSSRIDYAQLQANGEDLRFVDGDDITELAYEIESWNPAGTSYVWVQVPQINANSTTDAIFIYWGNVAIGPGANSTATWPTDAEIVYHFDHAPPDDVITDTNSTNAGSTRVNGFIDKSRDFSGSTHFDTNISLDPWLGDTATMMFWMNTTDLGSSDPHDGNALTGDRRGSSPQEDIAWGWLDDSGHIGLVTGNDNASSTTAINDGDWHHVVIQRDGSSGQQRVFVDGVLEDVQSGSVGIILPDSPFDSIGQVNGTGGTSDFEIEATIDEFELYSSYQSAAWALAQYKSQTDTLIEWCPLFDFYADTDNDGYGNPDDTVQACVQPIGYTADASDCDDTAGAINPGANEICDPANIDEDCSGSADDDDASATGHTDWFLDIDSDTFGDPATGLASCDPPSGRIADNTDCDDTNASAYPNALWYVDSDGDGYGDSGNTVSSCLQPANTSLDDTDCDDSNAAINPATEWFADDDGDTYGDPTSSIVQCSAPPSGVLNSDDCDDNDSAVNPDTLWYIDDDGDNFGVSGPTLASCLQPDGYANNTDDCDDTNAAAHPDAQWYVDNDNDGYGATGAFLTQCLQPSGYAGNNADCNDNDATLNPDTVWYHDSDGDLFGDPLDASNQCNQPNNHVSDNGDCDDANPAVNPNGTEVCGDGLDNDCDGTTDVGVGTGSTWYADADGDTYGDPGNTIIDCVAPDGYTADNQDCNDGDDTIFPGASEVCGDGFDSNCDGLGGPNGDDDGDGISYLDELAVGGWDCSGDTDGDTVPDAQEYLLGDTDGDGDFNINDFDDDNDGFPTEFEYENGA
ncbi:MAG: DUF2341 domain-containing protein, partial [Rhodobacterales bacterium]|nr:DUF2341 domain-containing protein [Rhodobacterales bacterium]